MMYSLSKYFELSKESGIASMDCPICARIYNPATGEHKSWPEVKNYYQYIEKCYMIASEVPFDALEREFYQAKYTSIEALNAVHEKVRNALDYLNQKDLNHMMGYTPISHMRQQLNALDEQIYDAIKSFDSHKEIPAALPVPKKRGFFARLFSR